MNMSAKLISFVKFISAVLFTSAFVFGCSSSENMPDTSDPMPMMGETAGGDMGMTDGGMDMVDLLSDQSAAIPECSETSGTMTVTGREITGTVDGRFSVTGTINEDTTITGGFALDGGQVFASYDGMVVGAVLSGSWADITGCSGTWSAEKDAA